MLICNYPYAYIVRVQTTVVCVPVFFCTNVSVWFNSTPEVEKLGFKKAFLGFRGFSVR